MNRIREMIVFSFPIILGQIGQMLIGAGDVYVAGLHSRTTLAAMGLANGLFAPVLVMGLAMHFGLSPLLARRIGEGQNIDHRVRAIVFYSIFNGLIFMGLSLPVYYLVPYLGYEEQLVTLIQEYYLIIVSSMPFAFIYQGLREYFQAKEKVLWANLLSIICVFLNIGVNWLLVFPMDMGIKGLAIASLIVRIALACGMLLAIRKSLVGNYIDRPFLKEAFHLSFPIAFSVLVEVSTFCFVTVFIGRFGEVESAAQNIVITIASIVFMVPLAISSATSTKVGNARGQQDPALIRSYAYSGLALSLGFMGLSALLLSSFPHFFFSIFSHDYSVFPAARTLLLINAFFQLGDGAQVTFAAILRGLGRTKIVFQSFFIGFWLFAVPLGIILATVFNMKSIGMWYGLASGIYIVAIFLGYKTYSHIKHLNLMPHERKQTTI